MNIKSLRWVVSVVLTFMIVACSSSKKEKIGNPDKKGGEVTAVIKTDEDDHYEFESYKIGGATAALRDPKNEDGLVELTMIFIDPKPLREIKISAMIPKEGKGTYLSSKVSDSDPSGSPTLYLDWETEDKTRLQYELFPSRGGQDGSGKLEISSLTEDRARGTFSGVVYTDDGKEAILEDGKFDVKVQRFF